MNLNFTKDQKIALEKLISWYKNDFNNYITLGGYAGTGKTTLITYYRNMLHKENPELKVAFCSYTGKAVRVLKKKIEETKAIYSDDTVSTIHSLIYSPIENERQIIIGWKLKDKSKVNVDLIIIDESSMIDQEIWRDLVSFKIPIIAVGDHGQLPPIKGKFNLIQKPMISLTKIHRQAENNPIIKVSIYARKDGRIPIKKYSNTVIKYSKSDMEAQDMFDEIARSFNNDILILCGYNNTRVRLNKFIRNSLEIYSPTPTFGDRVICLRNNHEKQIYNGMFGTIQSIKSEDQKRYYAEINMEDGQLYIGKILKEQFNNKESLNFTNKRRLTLDTDLFDFGYAITVHKAQGSESNRVVVLEERFKQMNDEQYKRWLYTAVTRAQKELYVVGD